MSAIRKYLSGDKISLALIEKIVGIPTKLRVNYETVTSFKKEFGNYIEIYMSNIRNSFSTKAVLHFGEIVVIESQVQLTAYLFKLKIRSYDKLTDITELEINGSKIKLAGLQCGEDLGVFTGAYNIDVRDKFVLDVFANICDSAIHFINSGAFRVVTVEVVPFSFNLLRKNVEINGLSDVIIPINGAVSAKSGIFNIPYRRSNAIGTGVNSLRYPDCPPGVEFVKKTLGSFIEEFDIESEVLKVDCEGCEYEALLGAEGNRIINAFDEIALEYHYGAERIENFLRELHYTVEATPEKSITIKIPFPTRCILG